MFPVTTICKPETYNFISCDNTLHITMVFVFKFTETLLVSLLVESLFKVWVFKCFQFLAFLKKFLLHLFILRKKTKNFEKYCRSKLYLIIPPPHSFYGTVLLPKEGIQQMLT